MQKGSLLSRAAAFLLLLLCAAPVWILAIEPVLREHRELDTVIADTKAQYRQFAVRRIDLKQLEARLETMRRTQSVKGEYLPETSPTLAGASLLGRLKKIVQDNDGTLTSSQIMPERETGDIPSVTIHARMSLTTPALQQILHTLETTKPYLFLDHLAISKQTRRHVVRRNDKVEQASAEDMLDVEFDITGYLEPRAAG